LDVVELFLPPLSRRDPGPHLILLGPTEPPVQVWCSAVLRRDPGVSDTPMAWECHRTCRGPARGFHGPGSVPGEHHPNPVV